MDLLTRIEKNNVTSVLNDYEVYYFIIVKDFKKTNKLF